MEYQKLIQDTLYWIQQEKKRTLYQAGSFFFPEDLKKITSSKKPFLPSKSPALEKTPPKEPEKAKETPPSLEKTVSPPEKPSQEIKALTKDFSLSFSKIRSFYEKTYPHIKLMDPPLEDGLGKKTAQAYIYKNQAAAVSLLTFQKEKKDLLFSQAIASAISSYFFPCKVIENLEKIDWESFLATPHLKLVIASEYSLWKNGPVKRFVKEIPQKKEWFLQNTPIFFLENLSTYYKDPFRKKALWDSLCEKLLKL